LDSFTLAVIGSSTAAGEGASSSSRGWVNLLAKELEAQVVGDVATQNLSVSGYSTDDLLPNSNADGNVDDAIDQQPNLILVALAGSNDLSSGVSSETFLSRLTAIRDAAFDEGIPVFFLSTAPKDLSNDEREALRSWAQQMGEEFGECWTPDISDYSPCFIDIFDALANSSLGISSEYSAGDGIHLNDAGHQVIFELTRDVVEPYVCSMTECP
jgi:lysophospholipase L1-like esterase